MNAYFAVRQALINLRANTLRSTLTMLGIIIGVSSVILLVTLVDGARSSVIAEFEKLGSNLIQVAFNPYDKQVKKSARTIEGLSMEDWQAIQDECDLVQRASPETGAGQSRVRYGSEEVENVRTNGVGPDYEFLVNQPVARGRFITDEDLAGWNKVCVIGETTRRKLFGKGDPLGRDIEVGGVSLTVVGVLSERGKMFNQETDNIVLVPVTTVQKRYVGRDRVDGIVAQAKPGANVEAALDQIWQTLMRRHHNAPGFMVDSQENILRAFNKIAAIFGVLVSGGAGLSLLVGGVGIMNIMLVSVTERTREIGLRKAVGARRRDVLWQFLIESATLSGVGGLIGIALGAGTAFGISAVAKLTWKNSPFAGGGIPAHLPLGAALGAFAFSALVGVFFGLYPAVRAARLDPIAALRHE